MIESYYRTAIAAISRSVTQWDRLEFRNGVRQWNSADQLRDDLRGTGAYLAALHITIYSQLVRAINLIDALRAPGRSAAAPT